MKIRNVERLIAIRLEQVLRAGSKPRNRRLCLRQMHGRRISKARSDKRSCGYNAAFTGAEIL